MHPPKDMQVGIENAANIFQAARHPKSFVSLDESDHLISLNRDAEYVADVIASWVRRYLDVALPPKPKGVAEEVVRVNEISPDGFLQDVLSGPVHHTPWRMSRFRLGGRIWE